MALSAERPGSSLIPRETVVSGLTSRSAEGSPFAFEPLIKPVFDPEPEVPRYFGKPVSSRTLYRWWNKISSFIDENAHGRRNSPTYNAVTGQIDDLELARILGNAGLIKIGTQMDLGDGLLKLSAVNQLALSRLDTASVVALSNQGYGFWPVIDGGADMNGVDKKQVHALSGAKEWSIRDINGLWFRDQRLVSDSSPTDQDYLPTAPEILRAFALFFDQEGFHPDSRRSWFLTRSFITESFHDVSKFIAAMKPEEIFLQGCINYCSYSGVVQQQLDKADPVGYLPTGIRVEKDLGRGSLKITYQNPEDLTAKIPVVKKLFRDRIFVMERNRGYLFVKGRNGTLESEGDLITIKNETSELRLSYDDVIAEIINQKKRAEVGFQQELDLPVVINANGKKGVQVGISLQGVKKELDDMSAFAFAQGKLKVHYREGVEELLKKKFRGLPIIRRHSWPLIFPDQYAGRLAVNKV